MKMKNAIKGRQGRDTKWILLKFLFLLLAFLCVLILWSECDLFETFGYGLTCFLICLRRLLRFLIIYMMLLQIGYHDTQFLTLLAGQTNFDVCSLLVVASSWFYCWIPHTNYLILCNYCVIDGIKELSKEMNVHVHFIKDAIIRDAKFPFFSS